MDCSWQADLQATGSRNFTPNSDFSQTISRTQAMKKLLPMIIFLQVMTIMIFMTRPTILAFDISSSSIYLSSYAKIKNCSFFSIDYLFLFQANFLFLGGFYATTPNLQKCAIWFLSCLLFLVSGDDIPVGEYACDGVRAACLKAGR